MRAGIDCQWLQLLSPDDFASREIKRVSSVVSVAFFLPFLAIQSIVSFGSNVKWSRLDDVDGMLAATPISSITFGVSIVVVSSPLASSFCPCSPGSRVQFAAHCTSRPASTHFVHAPNPRPFGLSPRSPSGEC